jgi:hypothetical protein
VTNRSSKTYCDNNSKKRKTREHEEFEDRAHIDKDESKYFYEKLNINLEEKLQKKKEQKKRTDNFNNDENEKHSNKRRFQNDENVLLNEKFAEKVDDKLKRHQQQIKIKSYHCITDGDIRQLKK